MASGDFTEDRGIGPWKEGLGDAVAGPAPLAAPEDGGGKGDGYIWTQDKEELVVHIPVPAGTSGKQVQCAMARDSLRVGLKGGGGGGGGGGGAGPAGAPAPHLLLDAKLPDLVDTSESLWSLCDDTIQITLCKRKAGYWECAVVGGPRIDTSQIDGSNKATPAGGAAAGNASGQQPIQITDPAMIAKLQKEHPELDLGSSGRIGVQAATKETFEGKSSFSW